MSWKEIGRKEEKVLVEASDVLTDPQEYRLFSWDVLRKRWEPDCFFIGQFDRWLDAAEVIAEVHGKPNPSLVYIAKDRLHET